MARVQRFNKLVRDNIPAIIRKNGEVAVTKKLGIAAFKRSLREKLLEEGKEVAEAKGPAELIKELADVEEVLEAIRDTEKISRAEVLKMKAKRRKERGGFIKRVFLIETK